MELSFSQLGGPFIPRAALGTSAQSLGFRPSRARYASKRRALVNACIREVPYSVAMSTQKVVDDLLERVEDNDGGTTTTDMERTSINALVQQLIDAGQEQPLMNDARLPGNYNVAYTSSDKRTYSPAGGRFRGTLGRKLFRGRGIFQHILPPTTVINLVTFRLLGLVSGAVGLRGKLEALPNNEIGKNGIKVLFDRPRIALGRFVFVFSRPSEVRLRTAYLDERVRIGVGSRGSLFVFTRGGLADEPVADEWMALFGDNTRVVTALSFFPIAVAGLATLGIACVLLARMLL